MNEQAMRSWVDRGTLVALVWVLAFKALTIYVWITGSKYAPDYAMLRAGTKYPNVIVGSFILATLATLFLIVKHGNSRLSEGASWIFLCLAFFMLVYSVSSAVFIGPMCVYLAAANMAVRQNSMRRKLESN